MSALIKGWYITPGGERIDMPEPANEDGTFSLEQLQAAVGGYIESVHSDTVKLAGKVVLADEEGLLKQLPINAVGSAIVGRLLMGNVVIIDKETWA